MPGDIARRLVGWEGRYRSIPAPFPRGPLRAGVTVVVPTWNAADLVVSCLESLATQELAPARVLVVDNGSTDSTRELGARFPTVEFHFLDGNLGYSGALAYAFALVDTVYVAILNNDAWPDERWLRRLVGHLDANPLIGGAYPLAIRTDGSIDTAGDVIAMAGFAYKRLHRRARFQEFPSGLFVSPPGVAPVYRVDAVVEAGGWDCGLHSQWDDVDLGIRMWQAGWDSFVDADARVLHLQGASSARRARSREFLAARNETVVLAKTMTPSLLVRMVPHHAVYVMLSLCSHLLRGTALAFVAGKLAALASLGAILRSRRRIRVVRPLRDVFLDRRWLRVWWGLSRCGGRRSPAIP